MLKVGLPNATPSPDCHTLFDCHNMLHTMHVSFPDKEKESELKARATRVLSLDYFLTMDHEEEEEEERGIHQKELEDSYRQSMLKSFIKTLSDGFFPFIIVEAVHSKVGL